MYKLIQLANIHCGPDSCPEPEAWVQSACELALVSMDEVCIVVADAVKGQNPSMLIQINANPPGFGRSQQFFLAIVPEGESSPRPVQAPGLAVVAQTAFIIRTFTFHLLVSHTDGDLSHRTGRKKKRLGKEN